MGDRGFETATTRHPPVDLDLPDDAVERTKAVGLWFEDGKLRVRAHLRDRYHEPRHGDRPLHQYRLELVVDPASFEIESLDVVPLDLPYDDCFDAPANAAERLIGERIAPGFGARAQERLAGELGCTHLLSLLGDLSIASLFQGYIRVRGAMREGSYQPPAADDRRTGICAGWREGGMLATWMASGRGIAPGRVYPELHDGAAHQEDGP